MSTLDKLSEILRDVLDDEEFVVTSETVATDHEDWDSLAQIDIIMTLEREFRIKFSLSEVEGLASVGDTVKMIDTKTG